MNEGTASSIKIVTLYVDHAHYTYIICNGHMDV